MKKNRLIFVTTAVLVLLLSAFVSQPMMTSITGFLSLGEPEVLTLSDGAVTANQSSIRVEEEVGPSGSFSDLDTVYGGAEGDILIVSPASGDTITVMDGDGNIQLSGNNDKVLNNGRDKLFLIRGASNWEQVSFSDN